MKHIFVINPMAGPVDATSTITKKIHSLGTDLDYVIHVTTAPGEATEFVHNTCQASPDESLRFYACGGDGTLNEVLTGLIGNLNAQLACYPCGSGNDYIKCYGTQADFNDIERLVNGEPYKVDVMRIGDRYSINVSNFGFDAEVCRVMEEVKRFPIIGGRNAYTTGIVKALFTAMNNMCRVTVDGEPFYDGAMLLATMSNGQYVGGAYRCAPRSVSDDGLLEVCLVSKVSLLRFAKLIGKYRQGTHLDDPACSDVMHYCRGRRIEITSPKPLYMALDGEVVCDRHFEVENMQQAISFVLPAKK
ncbi:MAG: YegS/Rv2252/BmrU family lipid kinase [Bacteroidales bacterium]|nr:YegS/Rv2252/BmrU family lipid kinase [Bacteroidales bacterium]